MPDVLTPIVVNSQFLSYEQSCAVAERSDHRKGVIVIDLSDVREAETAGFARLVLLRRRLLARGQDLVLEGLHGKAAGLHEVNRLERVLPLASATANERTFATRASKQCRTDRSLAMNLLENGNE